MIFEPQIWDIILIAVAVYLAVISLVKMMQSYRRELVISMRAMILEKRTAASEARKARRAALQEKQAQEAAAAEKTK